jgi:hypothetical protein
VGNTETFSKLVAEYVVVLGNTSYHNEKINKVPDCNSAKQEMRNESLTPQRAFGPR